MEVKNPQVAGGNPAGAAAGGPATERPAVQISIRKYGRGMNSPRLERRYLYLHITPFSDEDLEDGVGKAVDIINTLLAMWEPPIRREFFRPDMWWQQVACPYCRRRAEYELKKWRTGEYVWNRYLCLRHWAVYHLAMIVPNEPNNLLSNRPLGIVADNREMMFSMETVNYKYDIRIDRQVAEMEVTYKGSVYRFTYRNHLQGFPYLSSFMNILLDVYVALEVFRDFLTDYVLKRRVDANVVINDAFTIPAKSL